MFIQIHGTSVFYKDKGILLLGPPGSGKSDLALRLVDLGGKLIADDQTIIESDKVDLFLSCPPEIQSHLEIRGIGIYNAPIIASAKLDIVLNLKHYREIERFPNPQFKEYLGIKKSFYDLDPFELSVLAKIHLILSQQEIESCVNKIYT